MGLSADDGNEWHPPGSAPEARLNDDGARSRQPPTIRRASSAAPACSTTPAHVSTLVAMREPHVRDHFKPRVTSAVGLNIATEVTHAIHSPARGLNPHFQPAARASSKCHALPSARTGEYNLQSRPIHRIDEDTDVRPLLAIRKVNSKKVLPVSRSTDSQQVVLSAYRECCA
jgi:hypothetical protein